MFPALSNAQFEFGLYYHYYAIYTLANIAQQPITKRILNTADPTMVPIPTELLAMKTPKSEVNNSGADPPAAMKVAPATSSDRDNFSAVNQRNEVRE